MNKTVIILSNILTQNYVNRICKDYCINLIIIINYIGNHILQLLRDDVQIYCIYFANQINKENERGYAMIFSKTLKRIFLISILLFVTQTYAQETIIPLTKGGWVGGLSGNVSWDDYKINDSEIDGFGFSVSSRNGRFVISDLAVGFDFQWSEKELGKNISNSEFNRLGFVGLWIRYYIPFFGTGLAMYPEVSAGYGNYKIEKNYENSVWGNHQNLSADGFAYNIGIGITKFVSNNIAFEITGRYQGGILSGEDSHPALDVDDTEIEIELANIDILFGIMIYLK